MTFTEMAVGSLFLTHLSGRREKLQYEHGFCETVQEQNSSFVPSVSVQGYLVVRK